MRVSHNVVWPGRLHVSSDWDDVRKLVDKMKVGDTVKIEFEDIKDVDGARKAAQNYARDTLHCRESNWEIVSTKRENTLYLLKRAC